jgi:hypothetical protein
VASDERRSTFSTAVLFVGAAAGLAILVSLIGTLVSWARFWALDLPGHAASATLSQSTLLLRGANALAGPIAAGLAAAGITLLLRWLASRPQRLSLIAVGAVVALLLIVSAAAILAPWTIALYFALASAAVVAASLTPHSRKLRPPVAAYTIFLLVVGIGVGFLIWGALRPPTYLEQAEVTFSNGAPPLHGFWIAESSTTVYVAPRMGGPDGPCQVTGAILAFPREDVVSVRFQSAVAVWPQDKTPTPDPCR